MLHLPDALFDETLYSLLGRIAVINGLRNHLQIFEELFDEAAPTSIVGATGKISRFCESTNYLYGGVERVRYQFTLHPVVVRLNASAKVARAVSKISTRFDGSGFEYAGNVRHEWRECTRCRDRDLEELGFSYWRRAHQLPTTAYCRLHGVPLKKVVLLGSWLHERFWLPHQLVTQRSIVEEKFDPDTAMALTRLGEDALCDRQKPFRPEIIHDTFYEALHERGLITPAGKIRLVQAAADFNFTIKVCSETLKNHIRILLTALEGIGKPVPNQLNLLLVFWLFGTWKHFVERCQWIATINFPGSGWNQTECADNDEDVLRANDCYRRACLKFIQNNPTASRSVFLRQEYHTFRWLLHNDAAWLEQEFPSGSRCRNQRKLI